MRTLATLIRVHRHKLDEKRRKLAELQGFEDDLLRQGQQLEANLAVEQELAKSSEAGAFAYGAYAQSVLQQRATLAASLADIRERIAAMQAEVQTAFEDLKRHELALESRERRLRQEQERKRQIMLDEISLDMHRRRNA